MAPPNAMLSGLPSLLPFALPGGIITVVDSRLLLFGEMFTVKS